MAERQKPVKVWDILVRVFHWSFATLIVLAWLSHEWEREAREWHEWFGYAALALVGVRIVWGFVGPRYARFADFLHWPAHYVRYFGRMLTGREERYVGHNPLGGLMVIVMMALTIGTAATGYVLTQRGWAPFGIGHRSMEELHGVVGNLFLIAVPLHILGVVWESFRHRENLVGAMITGRKRA